MKLLSIVTFIALASVAQSARADSFTCTSSAVEHITVRVQDHVDAANGTRAAAILLVTDTNQDYGSRTLLSSTHTTQKGADWMVSNSDIADDATTFLGDFALSSITDAQLVVNGFSFNDSSSKDGQTYSGDFYLYTGTLSVYAQDIPLSCLYQTKN